jgi:putative hydroxymethylpyrimidine transport system substrate-binding protein
VNPSPRRLITLLLVAACALALTACGERDEPSGTASKQRVDLELDYLPNADHAGIYAALGTGEFDRAGLDVKPHAPSDPAAPLKLLAAGRVDLAISYEPELLLARDKGAKLVSVAALVQRPLTSLMSLKGIRDPAQLKGKTVGTAGIPYQDAYLKTILRRAGVPEGSVRKIDVGFNLIPAMLSKRVDATLGAFWNVEGVELRARKRKPQIERVDELGVPTYNELIIVAREQDVRERGAFIRRFLRALARGHARLRRDVDTGVDELVRRNRDLEKPLQRRQVRATLPAFFPARAGRPFGFQERSQWRAYFAWMRANDLLARPANVERAFTNEFLPGEGV